MTRRIILTALLSVIIAACSKNNNMTKEEMEEMARQEKEGFKKIADANADKYAKLPYFPAETFSDGQFYSVQITALSAMFFTEELDQHDLYGNGYCWAGIIEQLLEQKNPSLLKIVTFDPEADTCFISCPNEQAMNELAKTIHAFCSTKDELLNVLKSVDKSRLDC